MTDVELGPQSVHLEGHTPQGGDHIAMGNQVVPPPEVDGNEGAAPSSGGLTSHPLPPVVAKPLSHEEISNFP